MTTPETTPERDIQSMRADRLREHILGLLLPTTSELVVASGLTPQQVKDDIHDYLKAGFLDSAEIGCLLPGVPLFWPTASGLDHWEATEEQRTWFRPEALANMIYFDLPKLESVRDISRVCSTDEQPLSAIQFYEGLPMFAVAEHHPPGDTPTYAVFVWASLMDRERDVFHKLESLPDAMKSQLVDPAGTFYPGRVCIVAHDEWDANRALKLARPLLAKWIVPTNITAWYYRDGSWNFSDAHTLLTGRPPTALYPLLPGIGRLRPSISARKEHAKFEGIVANSLWSGRAGQGLFKVLTVVGKYPVAAIDHYKAWLGEAPTSTRFQDRLETLVGLGKIEVVAESAYASDGNLLKTWIREAAASPMAQGRLDDLVRLGVVEVVGETYAYIPKEGKGRKGKPVTLGLRDWSRAVPMAISQRGQGQPRYALTTSGRSLLCYAQGGYPKNLHTRTRLGRVASGSWNMQHEDCAYEVLAQWAEMGCPIAPRWMVPITLADGSRIEPDGAVLVETPLWGRTWCHLETELSDRTPRAIGPRCKRYGSPHRLDDGPLLIVAYNQLAEQHFQDAGRRYDLRMLTTTLGRLAEAGVAGPGVWSHYGTPVTLRA